MPVLLCASQKISSRLLFVCFTSEQRAFPSPHPGAPSDVAIQHNTSASWRCLRTIWFVRNWTECHRNELERKNRERVRNRKKKSYCEVTFKDMPPCHRITGLKWLLWEEAAILLFFKMQSNGFWVRVEKPFQHEVRGGERQCLERIVFCASPFPAWNCCVMVRLQACPHRLKLHPHSKSITLF